MVLIEIMKMNEKIERLKIDFKLTPDQFHLKIDRIATAACRYEKKNHKHVHMFQVQFKMHITHTHMLSHKALHQLIHIY